MENKNDTLFRAKNIEKIESPEALNDYLQVTSPGVWLALGTVIIFLIGACIWGIFGRIESTVKAAVVSTSNESMCLVPADALESVVENRSIKVNNTIYELSPESLEPEIISEDTNIYWILAGNLSIGDIVYRIPLSQSIPEGVYSGTIILETISPFSLLLN